jgi:hypothetical protein
MLLGRKGVNEPYIAVGPRKSCRYAHIEDDFSVLLQGNKLKINATVDLDGIARLKQVLDKYEEILKLLQ